MDVMREWILNLTGSATFCLLAMLLCPEGRVKKLLGLLCGIVMSVSLLSPVLEFEFDDYSEYMAKYRQEASEAAQSGTDEGERLKRTIIETECAAYILDKAKELSLDLNSVQVTASWSTEGFWYPYEVRVSILSEHTGYERLTSLIEAELGIPSERQYIEEGG